MNNWIDWNGGECPVERGTLVDVIHRDGERFFKQTADNDKPCRVDYAAAEWDHTLEGGDIIAYRLSEVE